MNRSYVVCMSLILVNIFSVSAQCQTWNASDYSGFQTAAEYSNLSDTYPAQTDFSNYPEWSWDYIPRWTIVRSPDVFTDDTIEGIANNFQVVILEKFNKQGTNYTEDGTISAAKRIKTINPDVKTFFYWQSHFAYTSYFANIEYDANADAWSAHNTDGSIQTISNGYYVYNFDVDAMRNWWVKTAVGVANSPYIDGVFVDKVTEIPDYAFNNGQPYNNYVNMLNTLRDELPANDLMIGNVLRNERYNGNREHMRYFDGSYLERWWMKAGGTTQSEAEAKVASLQLMREAALKGKMLFRRTTPMQTPGIEQPNWGSEEDIKTFFINAVDYPLAMYLIYAEKYSYFGYLMDDNTSKTTAKWLTNYIPILDHKLGAPLGPPTKNGYVFTRSFQYVDVWVNVETGETQFNWRDTPLPLPDTSANLALGGTASQSSTDYSGDASRAIDGNTDGIWANHSVTHTETENAPWWQVDLGSDKIIGDIHIFGRTDACCTDRLSDYTVDVIDSAGDVTFSQDFTSYPTASTHAGNVQGKIIKVHLNTTNALSLAEVQVMEGKASDSEFSCSQRIEAENYTDMLGVQTEPTGDIDGDENVGWIQNDEWISFANVDLSCGIDGLDVRVASQTSGGIIEVRLDGVSGALIGTISVGYTGDWQNYVTQSTTLDSLSGIHDVYLIFKGEDAGLFNINWLQFTSATSLPCATFSTIEAEDYFDMSGVQVSASTDTGGGDKLSLIHNGDWAVYNDIDLTCASSVKVRTASVRTGNIEVRLDAVDGTLIGAIATPNTGNWGAWVTSDVNISRVSGSHDIYLVFTGGAGALMNLNWLQFSGAE